MQDLQHPDGCVQPGCGANELACWIASDSTARIYLPACIAGDPGVRAGLKNEVDSRIGDSISIPLFEYFGCGGVTCPGTSVFVSRLGCIEVLGWEHSLELPRLDGANPPWKDKAIYARINCNECDTNCGDTDGAPVPDWGVRAVSLVH
jgi:hypothetical protein